MGTASQRRRSVLVTGAARGIGRATTEALAARGFQVFAAVRDPGSLVPFEDGRIEIVQMDVTVDSEVATAVDQVMERTGGALDCVVNNAGWSLFGAVEDVDIETAHRQFETNFFGALRVLQATLPAMRHSGAGVVINMSTVVGRIPLPLFGIYGASKVALSALSDSLAVEMRAVGVRVVHVEAGVVDTEFARSTVVSGLAGTADPLYGPIRDQVLGKIRGIRASSAIPVADVAAAIVAAIDEPSTPVRVLLSDPGLVQLDRAIDDAPDGVHAAVADFFGLPPTPTPPE